MVEFTHLYDERLATPAGGCADHAHVTGVHDKVLDAVVHTPAGGRGTPVDASLVDGLSSYASVTVDVHVACNRLVNTVIRKLNYIYDDFRDFCIFNIVYQTCEETYIMVKCDSSVYLLATYCILLQRIINSSSGIY